MAGGGQTESNSWGFLDKMSGDAEFYLCIGDGKGAADANSNNFHRGVCLGVDGSVTATRAALGLLYAATGTDADIDAAINALPGHPTGPFPGVTGAAWWTPISAERKVSARAWLRRKALKVVH